MSFVENPETTNLASPKLKLAPIVAAEQNQRLQDVQVQPLMTHSPRLEPLHATKAKLPSLPAELVLNSPRLPAISSSRASIPTSTTPPKEEKDSTQKKLKPTPISQYAMPLILLNMAGELVYILDRRLNDQGADHGTIHTVLEDLTKALLTDELLKLRHLVSFDETVQIFISILLTTPMRLPKPSMEALFELIIAIFKHQILNCQSPNHYLIVTQNHLKTMRQSLQSPEMNDLIQNTIDRVQQTYEPLTTADWRHLQEYILGYLGNHKMKKIEVLMKHNQQTADGLLVIDNGGQLPEGGEVPGAIRFYEGGVVTKTKIFENMLSSSCTVRLENTDDVCAVGTNIWNEDHSNQLSPQRKKSHKHAHDRAKKRLDSLISRSQDASAPNSPMKHASIISPLGSSKSIPQK
mmetsp:Transcript_7338/g.7552  ORF Transcript_7338/g.7552 Transcript_7338/m.7552 type:complete len:407 (+) Transcript_7338:241-1461(+)|eukprot:CAMPEP_0182429498 /NCGR_PEP_ID=MMETSP1167-20130531/29679_1 /TAXON_ID=2988 /ORGANISM="Mallomonas Sp, Strain CCMP3275" /LENGTH=406 /DNA_ID=CAMNT_0024613255 /DNA_START=166 /DNA_END=1386 /DNA_ORIENTATION=-